MALSRITEAVASFTDLTIGDDLTLTDDFLMASDASIIKFGADADVTLTHVHNTGLLLNSTSVIQFNDSSQNIGAPNATTLDINATDEIELNATLVDINANLDVSGTYTGAGLMTTGGNIVIPDAGNIGSASDTDAIAISSGGVVTFSQNPVFPDGGISIADLDIDGASDIGEAIVDADLFIIDNGAGGTNRKVAASRIKTYIGASTAADDLTAGDAAVNLTTTSGNITIDAAANDSDIIFKGTDNSSDITMLTLDGSEAGAATFNSKIIATELDISGDIDVDGTTNLDTTNVVGAFTVTGDVTLNDGSPNLRLNDTDTSRFIDILYGTRVATFRNTMASGEDMDTVEPSIVFSFQDDGETRTALTIDHDARVLFNGEIITSTSGTANFRAGDNAGDAIASGAIRNVVVGDEAGTAITTGTRNVAVGYQALATEDTGSRSVAIGHQALTTQNGGTNDIYNIGVGHNAGGALTTGVQNTFIGGLAGDAQTVADNNTAVGFEALTTNTNGSGSVAIGFRALKTQNYSSATDSLNVAVGNAAMQLSTTGVRNVALGTFNLSANTTGSRNTAVGYGVMQTCTEGEYNTAIGHNALNSLTTATYNTAIGPRNSGDLITTGSQNTIVGDYNGNQSGLDIRTLSNRIILSDGDGTVRNYVNNLGFTAISNTLSSSTRFNSGSQSAHVVHNSTGDITQFIENSHGSNPYGLYIHFSGATPDNNSEYFLLCADSTANRAIIRSNGNLQNANNSYGAISDEKLKEQIKDSSSQWDDIKALQVRKFKMKEDVAKGDSDEHWKLGVVAQELETAGMGGLVDESPDLDENNKDLGTKTKSVKYSILYMKAVKALQEAMTRIETLETKVKVLEG